MEESFEVSKFFTQVARCGNTFLKKMKELGIKKISTTIYFQNIMGEKGNVCVHTSVPDDQFPWEINGVICWSVHSWQREANCRLHLLQVGVCGSLNVEEDYPTIDIDIGTTLEFDRIPQLEKRIPVNVLKHIHVELSKDYGLRMKNIGEEKDPEKRVWLEQDPDLKRIHSDIIAVQKLIPLES